MILIDEGKHSPRCSFQWLSTTATFNIPLTCKVVVLVSSCAFHDALLSRCHCDTAALCAALHSWHVGSLSFKWRLYPARVPHWATLRVSFLPSAIACLRIMPASQERHWYFLVQKQLLIGLSLAHSHSAHIQG